MFFPSRARLASWHPPMQRRRNLENSAVPTLPARGSRLGFRATMCRAVSDLEARWNRILTIFDPYTFSHSQGHEHASRMHGRDGARNEDRPQCMCSTVLLVGPYVAV